MNGRVLIIVGIIILLLGIVGFVVFTTVLGPGDTEQPVVQEDPNDTFGQQGEPEPADDRGNDPPTPTPIDVVEIVIAVQELPRGFRIPANAVAVRRWPAESVPVNAVLDVEEVVNKIARTDIFREQPILNNMLVSDFENLENELGRVGSDAAAILPNSLVAVAMPMDRQSSVAYAVQDGDRVDVIVSMLFVNVDEGFQSLTPNGFRLILITEDGIEVTEPLLGRPDSDPFFGAVLIQPSEIQRPRVVSQAAIQDALVVHVGEFPDDGRFIGIPPTPTPIPVEEDEAAEGEEAAADAPPTPTPIPPRPNIITLGVTPQDAVLLTWAIESRVPLNLALRSASDTSRVPTEPVTLDFFMQEYRITVPARRDYTIEPAVRSIRQLDTTSERQSIGGGSFLTGATEADE